MLKRSPMPRLALKPKACKVCGVEFIPSNSFMRVCGPKCAVEFVRRAEQKRLAGELAKRERLARADTRKRRAALITRKQWLKKAKAVFHRYIRMRDLLAGHNCICCGQPFQPNKPGGSIDAGHYRSVGSAKHMEFIEDNVHAQRKGCNRSGQNRHEAYRLGLIQRIGIERVEALERDQSQRHYTIADFQQLDAIYRRKCLELKRSMP